MKIVDDGYKIDLHIHSCFSNHKDGKKVSFNTIDNIGVLANKLNENSVQICAITDHDAFNFDLYSKLKKYENDTSNSLVKVFPGVEFSVGFASDNSVNVQVHVIAIFDDSDEEKLKKIDSIIKNKKGLPDYDDGQKFSEEKFLSILRLIDIDTVLIAHQKNTLSSVKPKKDDANSVGTEKFEEFVATEYFEAFEFKNRRNEIFNKNYLLHRNETDNIRFITGSDCHDWREYPKEDSRDKVDFTFTFVKCLPTFKGLVMAITDHRRIKLINSFFNVAEKYLDKLKVSIHDIEYQIPLSRGINVIIGDNSIGKSLLLHKLTSYEKLSKRGDASIKKGYDKYLEKNGYLIKSEITKDMLFMFDMQGEIREKFIDKKVKYDDFLQKFYPPEIKTDSYKEILYRELNKIYKYLENKISIEMDVENLGSVILSDFSSSSIESLSFTGEICPDDSLYQETSDVVAELKKVNELLNTVLEKPVLVAEDKKELSDIKNKLNMFSNRFVLKKNAIALKNRLIRIFNTIFTDFKLNYQNIVSDEQKRYNAYNNDMKKIEDSIVSIVLRNLKNSRPEINFEPINVSIDTNKVYNYNFNSRINNLNYSPEYLFSLIEKCFSKNHTRDIFSMNMNEISSQLLRFDGNITGAVEYLKGMVSEKLESDFEQLFTITEAGKDRTEELSDGLNSRIYFDLLSYSENNRGIYIIDQPEDNVSPKAISEYLLDNFKKMGENRQVIMVTHNPQFIVNLDVDNVIYIGKNDSNQIVINSGALEYSDENYSMLEIISRHIDGGLETLQRRMKRYEKNSKI